MKRFKLTEATENLSAIVHRLSKLWYGHKEDNYNHAPKLRTLLLITILLTSLAGVHIIQASTIKASQLQENIAGEIIRFHVIANSNSTEDQNLKLKVKEALVKEMSIYLSNANSINEARKIVLKQMDSLQSIAEDQIAYSGFDYSARVSLEPCYFPIKIYGDYTFPAGTYEALRVQIGEAKGQNWWCVMFPPLCFVDETYTIVDEKTDEQLQYLLTQEEYETLKSTKAPVKVKFKIWEYVKKLFR